DDPKGAWSTLTKEGATTQLALGTPSLSGNEALHVATTTYTDRGFLSRNLHGGCDVQVSLWFYVKNGSQTNQTRFVVLRFHGGIGSIKLLLVDGSVWIERPDLNQVAVSGSYPAQTWTPITLTYTLATHTVGVSLNGSGTTWTVLSPTPPGPPVIVDVGILGAV